MGASVCLLTLVLAAPPPLAGPAKSLEQPTPARGVELTHCLVSLIEDVQVPTREAGALTNVAVVEGQYVNAGAAFGADQRPAAAIG